MKYILALLCCFVNSVLADERVDNMTANCQVVMDRGVCRVQLDPKDYKSTTIAVAWVGKIQPLSYLKIRNAGDEMCKVVRTVCEAGFEGDAFGVA